MRKKAATDAAVLDFIAAVYPDAPELARAAFDEATMLVEATRQLREHKATQAQLADLEAELRRFAEKVPHSMLWNDEVAARVLAWAERLKALRG